MKSLHLPRSCRLPHLSLAGLLALAFLPGARAADSLQTGSRMPFHHVIPLRDAEGNMISLPPAVDEQGKPQEAKGLPFSTAQTCGRCHDYPMISQGWHFNAAKGTAKPGRPGEPWILTDPATRTQIPLSYRGWNGTLKPSDLGVSDFDFLLAFGRHYPGGGVGETPKDKIDPADARMRRFLVSGPLEIDCLICHTRHGDYDHEARAKAIANENFKWSPTISSELGAYGAARNAKAFADAWRPPRPAPTNFPPVKYERKRFDLAEHVTFEVTRKAPAENCFFCHTSNSEIGDARWHSDGDVHLRAGMRCVDCHRNGIDHQVVRGYDGETADRTVNADQIALRVKYLLRDQPGLSEADAKKLAETELKTESDRVETLSCRGCHYGSSAGALAGRLGAPEPVHKGIPPVHFDRLTCTACHSGPFPSDTTGIVQTSLAHKLGLPAPPRGANTAPVIVQPAFLKDASGRIAPHKMVWPSYWGFLKDNKVKALLPEEVAKAAGDKLPKQSTEEVERDPYNTKPLTDPQIKEVLAALPAEGTNGAPVFLAAGKLYRLDGGNLKSEEHDAAKPYAWALAHDVRPASQAVGAKGCADCHAKDSPIFFASVTARGPVEPGSSVTKAQWALRGEDSTLPSTFAFTFNFRPMLKIMTFTGAALILGVLLGRALVALSGTRSPEDSDSK